MSPKFFPIPRNSISVFPSLLNLNLYSTVRFLLHITLWRTPHQSIHFVISELRQKCKFPRFVRTHYQPPHVDLCRVESITNGHHSAPVSVSAYGNLHLQFSTLLWPDLIKTKIAWIFKERDLIAKNRAAVEAKMAEAPCQKYTWPGSVGKIRANIDWHVGKAGKWREMKCWLCLIGKFAGGDLFRHEEILTQRKLNFYKYLDEI